MSRKQLEKHFTTPLMEKYALALGASQIAVYQWRRRGVPKSWQVKMVMLFPRRFSLKDFESPKGKFG